MNDLISRQAAIDALIELYEYQRDIDPTEAADLVRQGIYLAEKKIEQLPPVTPEQRWIPCSERLPEEGCEALGTDKYGSVRHVIKDKCGASEFATYEEMMHVPIVAWMPLPEPYKGGGQDE